jgi:phosphatidylserine decarboxylase
MEVPLDSSERALTYIDRETGTVKEERIYGRAALHFAYRTVPGRILMRLLPHVPVSRLYGVLARLPASRSRIPRFVEQLGIDAAEAELPLSQYRSLDEFFCRRLKRDARPIDQSPLRFLAPADGRALVYPRTSDHRLVVKGCPVCLTELLGDPALVSCYDDGIVIVVRLAPCDYHRFHFPASGTAGKPRLLSGRLHSVHPFALENQAPSFRNKRAVTVLESGDFGRVTLVEIGAFAVGTIVQTYAPGSVRGGEEKGYFRFGGSTVVALVSANRMILDEDIVRTSERGLETFVKMGSGLGTAVT